MAEKIDTKTVKKSSVKTPKVEVKKVETPVAGSESEAYLLMDRQNEEQILTEINGKGQDVADQLVYSFMSGGKEVVGLSWVGTKMCAYYMRQKKLVNISFVESKYTLDPADEEYVLFEVVVEDLISKARSDGSKRQWKKMSFKDGSVKDNPFWFEVGKSKAKRNAMQDLMPADWIAKQILQWKKEGKVLVLGQANGAQRPMDAKSVGRIAGVLNKINAETDKVKLKAFKDYIIKNDKLNGQEKNTCLKAIEAREKQI